MNTYRVKLRRDVGRVLTFDVDATSHATAIKRALDRLVTRANHVDVSCTLRGRMIRREHGARKVRTVA